MQKKVFKISTPDAVPSSPRRPWISRAAVLVLAALSLPAYAEGELPTAVQFVASSEVMIEACAGADSSNAQRYRSLRPVLNTMFAKRNYTAQMQKPEYEAARKGYQREVDDAPPAELLKLCKPMLKLHDVPQGVAFHD